MGAKTTSTDNEYLKGGEQRLVNALRAGEPCEFVYEGKGKEPDAARTLRGEVLGQLLRGELVEGETERIKLGRAVKIEGAIITGTLDMSYSDTGLALRIEHSIFEGVIDFTRAKLAELDLGGSTLFGATMGFLSTESHLWLKGIENYGEFNLTLAEIGGHFVAFGAAFLNPKDYAIHAESAKFDGDVFLQYAEIKGIANFSGSKIVGRFIADHAQFINPNMTAINFMDIQINRATCLTDMPHPIIGDVDFTSAVLNHIVIDDNSMPLGRLILDGTRYNQLRDKYRTAMTDCAGWLSPKLTAGPTRYRAAYEALFYDKNELPPANDTDEKRLEAITILRNSLAEQKSHTRSPFAYRQFAKMLDSNGHESEAREVRLQAGDAYTERTAKNIKSPIMRGLFKGWRKVLKGTTGYGERLQYAAYWLIGLWLFGAVFFYLFEASIVPSRERFYLSEAYTAYLKNGTLPNGYPAFDPLIYALDVMLPIVDFSQETHWRPTNTDEKMNWVRLFNRLYLGVGWFLSTIGIAGLTGLLKDKREP